MDREMSPQAKANLQLAAAILLAVVAGSFVFLRTSRFRKSSEENAKTWFYDESEKRLYAAPHGTIPPDQGIGGKSGDGVRAVVVAPASQQNDPARRQIAYLETYTTELKQLLEKIKAGRASRLPRLGPMPSRDSPFFQTNTLVRRLEETDWYPESSAQGRKILSEWRGWRSPDGQPMVVCLP